MSSKEKVFEVQTTLLVTNFVKSINYLETVLDERLQTLNVEAEMKDGRSLVIKIIDPSKQETKDSAS